jgi:hypothetical protein
MKFKQILKTNILTFDDELASLEAMNYGNFRYILKFFVNPQLALQQDASKIKITISKNPNIATNIPIFNTLTPSFAGNGIASLNASQAISQILQKSSVIKDIVRSSAENNIMSINVDYTSKISNNLAKVLSKKDTTNPIIMNSIRSFTAVPLSNLKNQNLNVPILEHSLLEQSNNSKSSDNGNIKNLSFDLLLTKGIDPASLIVKQNAVVNSIKTFGGIYQKINENHKLDFRHKDLLTSFQNLKIKKPRIENLPINAIVNVPLLSNVSNVLIQEFVDIPFFSINSEEFHIIFELLNEKDVPVQRTIKFVNHSKNVNSLVIPKKPPLLKVVPVGKIGKNTIEIKQRDPNAIGVNLYRKIIRNNKSQNDAEYTFVGKIPLTINDGYKTIDDLVSNANTIIYRAIPYGQNNKLSFEFESAVTKPVKIPINLSSFHRKPNFSTMTYETLDSGIVIKFSNIPIGPVSLVLMKKDLTSNQKAIYVDIPKILNKKGSEEIVFKDTNVTKNRIYRYFYKYIYINGQEQFGSNDLTIEYKPETSNVVNTIILNPRVVQQGINLDVQFSLESNFIEKSENALLNALRIQGLNEFFNESINKDNLQDLIGYGIVRINLTNGDIEDFGINTQKNFSDFKFGNTKGVKPIKSGNEYQYIVSTYFRSAITMLEKYEKFEEFSNSSNFNYSFKPFEWLHPITLKKGNLVSKRSLVKNHAQSQFSFGEIGNITTTTVSIASILPSIYSIDASKVNSKLIKIQWKIQGEVSKIDHFIILVDILGMRSTVGKCHNISDSNYFEFLDELTNGESGALTYIVIPVYYDYSRGKEMQTNKVLV